MMTDYLLFGLAILLTIGTAIVFYYLYRTQDERHLGLVNGRRQGMLLILWISFLAIFTNLMLPLLVEWNDTLYGLVTLPILLMMVALIFWIIFQRKSTADEDNNNFDDY